MQNQYIDRQYENLLEEVLLNGAKKTDRTGTGTLSVFARQLRYDLSKYLPVITTKRVYLKAVIAELLWFLSGSSNIGWLKQNGISIWDSWADDQGNLGPVYGAQWRSWGKTHRTPGIDQISRLIDTLRTDPHSRRMLVSAWNVSALDQMALAPCHLLFQVYVANDTLSLQVYQRSADLFLGVPFNITSYALLANLLAAQSGLHPGELIWTGGDCHIYSNHVEQVKLQLQRSPYPFPRLQLDKVETIFDYDFSHIHVLDYHFHPTIKGDVAV